MPALIRGPRHSRPIEAVAMRGHKILDEAMTEALHRDVLPDYNVLRIGSNLIPITIIEDRGPLTNGGRVYRVHADFGRDTPPREFECCECHLSKR